MVNIGSIGSIGSPGVSGIRECRSSETGKLESWNNGILGAKLLIITHSSNIPIFHYRYSRYFGKTVGFFKVEATWRSKLP